MKYFSVITAQTDSHYPFSVPNDNVMFDEMIATTPEEFLSDGEDFVDTPKKKRRIRQRTSTRKRGRQVNARLDPT